MSRTPAKFRAEVVAMCAMWVLPLVGCGGADPVVDPAEAPPASADAVVPARVASTPALAQSQSMATAATPAFRRTSRPLQLVATMVATDPANSTARILDGTRDALVSVSVGGRVGKDATVSAIEPRRVWLDTPQGREVVEITGPVEFEQAPTRVDQGLVTTAPVPAGGAAVGSPHAGYLQRGVALPENPRVYTIRKPAESYGTSHAIESLQRGLASFRATFEYDGPILVGSISREGGGPLRPHVSHQTGRDVDVRLPGPRGSGPAALGDIDWAATWALVAAVLDTGQVEAIFLDYDRQAALHAAALRAGQTEQSLRRVVQFPDSRRSAATVQHVDGHSGHIHIRFVCGPDEPLCRAD